MGRSGRSSTSRDPLGRSPFPHTHQVALVEKEDEVLVPQMLPYVLLEEKTAGTHRVSRIKNLQAGQKDQG